ncbi:MAG: PRC and DUF2382 domain-containing protein, partial [Corynebacterium sp.]|nr:PRC and DUF2382 domain-containing protein [Corynebacterium sp.]
MVNRNIDDLFNATAYDNNGDKLGSVKEVYINDTSGQPEFVEVGHGLFGMSSSLVPLRGHQLAGEELRLAFTKDRISDAPDFDSDAHLSDEDQLVIYRHYGLEGTSNVENYGSDLRDHDRNVAGVAGAPVPDHGQDGVASDRNPVDAANATEADSLTLSEERLNVDKQRVETGQVRLRKYVVHDTETVEVPVEREEVRIERTPIDGTHADTLRGGALEDDEAAITVSEERVSVTKDTVPVEEVSLRKETVRDTETVSEDVAHEELDVDGAVDGEIDGNGEDGRHLRRRFRHQ